MFGRLCLSLAAVLIIAASLFAQTVVSEKIISPELKRQLALRYTQQEAESLEKLVAKASAKGFPQDYFLSRLSEAVAKKAKYRDLVNVLEKKYSYFERAQNIIGAQKRAAQDPGENIVLGAELLERGLHEKEISFISANILKDASLDELLDRAKMFVALKEAGYLRASVEKIIISLSGISSEDASRIIELLVMYPSASAAQIAREGLGAGRRIGWFRDKLSAENKKEKVKEVLEDERTER
ncbi:MAG: hypothetical protein ABII64_06030 [Elusimicrobiota bacterium]